MEAGRRCGRGAAKRDFGKAGEHSYVYGRKPLRHMNRQRVKKSQLKLSFCLLVTLIWLWSMALALEPKSPKGWSWGRAGSGRALECICLRNNCD